MTRTRWAAVLALYGIISVVVSVFAATQAPPCFGSVPTGQMSPACVAAWQASRSLAEQLVGTPIGALVLFLALTGGTWLVVRLLGRRPRES